jgi:hypothetical protein
MCITTDRFFQAKHNAGKKTQNRKVNVSSKHRRLTALVEI